MKLKQITLAVAGLLLFAACGDLTKGKKPKIEIFLGTTGESGQLTYTLANIIPGSQQKDTVQVSIRNVGDEVLNVSNVRWLETNEDGTPKNQYVSIEWGGFDPQLGFPRAITNGDFISYLDFKVVYEPLECGAGESCDYSATSTLEVLSDSPDEGRILITFGPPKCLAQPIVSPGKDTFFNATPTSPETKTFQIINEGTCPTTVDDLRFKGPTNVFTLERQGSWPNGTTLDPQNEGGQPLVFKVKYQPTFTSTSDNATVQVLVSNQSTPIEVPLATKLEAGAFEISHNCGGDKAKLDFTANDGGCETCTVVLHNIGPASMQVTGAEFSEDPDETHYSCEFVLPENPGQPLPCDKTVGRGAGSSLDINVTYCGSLNGLNATLAINYNNPGNGTAMLPAFGGKPKPCFDFSPGDAASPLPMQWIATQNVEKTRPFYIYNCGNADLQVDSFRFEDAFGLGNPSEYFSHVGGDAPPFTVAAGAIYSGQVQLLVTDNEIEPTGVMYIDYTDGTGAQVTDYGVSVKGHINPAGTPPVAKPTSGGDATVSQQHTLVGIDSEPGSEGIAEKGYVWFLVSKPAGSQVIVNGGPGLPVRSWVPDVAGKYTFGLMVHGNSGDFLYSDVATLDVTAAAGE